MGAEERDYRTSRQWVLLGCAVVVTFVIYYLLWIRRMTDVSAMRDWWQVAGSYLPVPISFAAANKGIQTILSLFENLGVCWPAILACFIVGSMYCISKKDRLGTGIILGLAVALFASCIKFYPVVDRLWMFAVPLVILLGVRALDLIAQNKPSALVSVGALVLIASLCNEGIGTYGKSESVYQSGEEYKQELAYLNDHIQMDDMVYVYAQTVPGFEYTNGFDNDSIGGYPHNVIMGKTLFTPMEQRDPETDALLSCEKYHIDLQAQGDELKTVMSYPSCYVVTSHTLKPKSPHDRMRVLVETMQSDGFLDLVSYEHETALWHHYSRLEDCKTKAELRHERVDGSESSAWITVENIGEAYLGNPYDSLCLERDDGVMYSVEDILAPGKSTKVRVSLHGEGDTQFTLRYGFNKNMPRAEITIPHA